MATSLSCYNLPVISCNMWLIFFLVAVGVTLRCIFLAFSMNPSLMTASTNMMEEISLPRQDPIPIAAATNRNDFKTKNESLLNIPMILPQPTQQQDLPVSTVHCIGETFLNDTSPLFRSCQYTNLCFHARHNEFVLYPSIQHKHLRSMLHEDIHLSSVVQPVLAAAVPHPPRPRYTADFGETWKDATSPESKMVWQEAIFFPKLITELPAGDTQSVHFVYQDDSVWIPLYPWWSGCDTRTGDVIWDVMLPIYTLLELFDLTSHNSVKLLLLSADNNEHCIQSLTKYSPWLGLEMVTPRRLVQAFDKDVVICNSLSVAGLGAHAEHVTVVDHRQVKRPSNLGRAMQMRNFRNYIHRKLNFRSHSADWVMSNATTPSLIRVVISDKVPNHFLQTLEATKSQKTHLQILLSHLDVMAQIAIVQQAHVLILKHSQEKTCALFLPDHATLVFVNHRQARQATSLDWELWNNYPFVRTHLIAGRNVTAQQEAINYIVEEEYNRQSEKLFLKRNVSQKNKPEVAQLNSGQSITLIKERPPLTHVHCMGESRDYDEVGYRYRSCHFENLCFDLKRHDFVVFPSNVTQKLEQFPQNQFHFSTVLQPMVASGFVPVIVSAKPYMPRVVRKTQATSYYYLDAAWLSYQTFNTCNYGHMFWDNFLPIHAMIEMFGLTGDFAINRLPFKGDCPRAYNQVEVPFFGLNHSLRPLESQSIFIPRAKSRYICARQAASGYGALNDHFLNQHGWKKEDRQFPHNVGRGPELRRLRARLLQGLNLPTNKHVSEQPVLVTFSIRSSRVADRRLDFSEEIEKVKSAFTKVKVRSVQMWRIRLYDQLRLASRSTIYISAVGGGTFPAFFLPKGATLILYGDKDMYLDFDLLNNYGQVHVHWLSLKSRQNDTGILIELIRDELCRLGNNSTPRFNFSKFSCPLAKY